MPACVPELLGLWASPGPGRFHTTPISEADYLLFRHILEHLEGVINKPEAEMSPQELQLHYFKMHDYDGNGLLDGLELSTAITHVHKEVGQAAARQAGLGGPCVVVDAPS